LVERKQQSQFRESLIENAPIGVAVLNREMRYVLANPAYRSIAGAADTPVVGRTVAEVFPPDVAGIVQPFVQQVFDSGELLHIPDYEAPVRGRTWWNVSEIPLRNAAGNVEAVLLLTEEVTERKQASAATRPDSLRT
jgi:PAS domain S-box-containing protein